MLEIQTKLLETPTKIISSLCEENTNTMPILQMAVLRVENGVLSIIGTDSMVEITYQLPVDSADIAMTVPAKKLADIVKSLKNKVLTIRYDEPKPKVKLTSGSSRFNLNSLPVEDFPGSREFTGDKKTLVVSGIKFATALNCIAPSMPKNDVRYYLNGVFLDAQGKDLNLVATDGHRLAMDKLSMESDLNYQAILPRTLVLKLQSILDKYTKEIQITGDEGLIEFKLDNCIIRSKLIDGRYPEWQSVFPNPTTWLEIAYKPLREALKRVEILTNEKFKGVRLKFEGGLLTIEGQNPERESAIEELQIENIGNTMIEIGFNVAYLIQALDALKSDVKIGLTDESHSIILTVGNACCVIMPMRL